MDHGLKYEVVTLQDEYYLNNTEVFMYHIEYLKFYSHIRAFHLLNEKNLKEAKTRQSYAMNTLYGNAVQSYLRGSKGLPYEYSVHYRVTENNQNVISGYADEYMYTGGAHGTTYRKGFTYDAKTGKRKQLCDFMANKNCEECIINLIIEKISTSGQTSLYFPNYADLVRKTFDKNNFYMTPHGVVVFFKQYDVAPYSSGIRSFVLPINAC